MNFSREVPLRILMLEDSAADAELNAHMLRKAGIEFTSTRVEQRDEFIAALLEFKPDLVLADFRLPHFDGMSALAIVRERHPHLPFIFVTGAMGEETAVDSLHQGANDYVLKDRLHRLPEAAVRALDEAEARWQLFRTEQLLANSEARFRSLVETTTDWIWEINAEGRYTYSSPAVLPLLGYSADEVIGRTPFELMPRAEAEWVGHRFAEIAAARQPISQLENVCLHRDGHSVILETSGVPVFAPDGSFAGYRGIDRDITQRKQAEAALRDSEMKFRLLSENAADCIFWTAPNGRFVYVSPACKMISGYDPEDFLDDAELMTRILHPDDLTAFQTHLHNLSDIDEKNLEYRIIHRDGSVRWISHHCRAIHDADGLYLGRRGSNSDITARKLAEISQQQSEARLHAIQHYARLGSWELEKDLKTAIWSAETFSILGLPADVKAGPESLRRVVEPEDWMALENSLRHSFASGEEHHAEYRIRSLDDGVERWIDCRGKAILGSDGRPEKLAGFVQDISERRQAEAVRSLQARRAEALLELPRAAEQLDEAAFMQRGQELAEDLTGSQIAFIHFVHDDQETIELVTWSRRTLEDYCQAAYDKHYPVSQAGIWADALRKRQAVMVNDYANASDKHGLPEGHAHLERLISVPVIEGGLVRMLTGVGNKATPYTEMDLETVQLISNEIWRIVRQRRAEKALRESEARLRSILRATPVGIGVVIDRVFTEANQTMQQMTGYSREELIGQTSRMLYLSDEEFERVGREKYAQIRERGIGTVETRFRCKNGEIRDIFLSSAMTDSDVPGKGVTFSAQDITERKQTENMLRKLAQAVEQSPESIVITDLDANLEYVNETFVRNTGYSRDEALGQNPRILHSGKTPRSTFDALWNAMRLGLPWQGEFCNKRKDGSEYVEFAIITPLRQPDGSVTHYVAVKEDITEKKHNALELDQHRLHLEELVESRTLELRASQQEAERLARVKSEFLANMSHEIRTPLNAVLGFAQIGQRDSENRQDRDSFGRILDSGQLLLRVVNDILDYSKIEAGKLEIEKGRLRPGSVLDRCAALVRDTAMNKGLAFEIEESAELPASCDGDELRVTQVLMNLLTNAIKFTQQGSVTLSASRQNSDAAEVLTFRVADSGIGMNPEELAHLFLPFEQADSSTTRRFGGTGLGLAISKRLLDLMGGQISVSSQPGQGSVFEVNLPLLHAEGLAAARAPAVESAVLTQAGPSLQGLDILVAEDNEVNRMVLANLLAKEGCQLIQVENGRLAVELVQARGADAFDLVLMDIQMPVLDGLAATREIKAIAPDLPVIGLTAHALAEERENCLAAGMIDHVAKPIVLADLLKAIRTHVSGLPELPPGGDAIEPDRDTPTPSGTLSIDWPSLEFHYRDNREFFSNLLTTIVASNRSRPKAIQTAIEQQDFAQLAFITHSLKGMAGDILPGHLRDLAGLTESAARHQAADAFSHASILAAGLNAFLADIEAYIERTAKAAVAIAEENSAFDPAEVKTVLARLNTLLTLSDTAVNTLQTQSVPLLRRAFGAEADLLGREIQGYDYDAALVRLRGLQQRLDPQTDDTNPV